MAADLAARLRDVLLGHDYTEAAVRDVLGAPPHHVPKQVDRPRLLRLASDDSPLHVLCRLFLVDVPVALEDARSVFAPLDVESLVDAELLARNGDSVCATVRLLPYRGLLVATDVLATPILPDTVMGIGSSTVSLANAMVPRPARRVLDLGTGCGILALLAAAHADAVWATDINPRATAMAEFNARLNGIEHVTCRTGNLFEPVDGLAFDLIVSSPPYVISPESRLTYRDSAMRGDAFCRQLLRAATLHLEEGGFAQVLLNWPQDEAGAWRDSFVALMVGSGCDLWLLRSETRSVEDYASVWIDETTCTSLDEYAATYERWMQYYEAEGIETIGHGLVTLRKRSRGGNWLWLDDAPDRMLGPAGEDILLGFELHDFVLDAGEDVLLDTAFRLDPHVRVRQELVAENDSWHSESMQLRRVRGLAWTANVDPYVAGLAARCDGLHPLRGLIATLSEATGQTAETLIPLVLDVVRSLVDRAFLLPAD